MVAEIHANVPEGTDIPSAEVATNAIAFAVGGKRNVVNFAAPQGGSTVATEAPPPQQQHWGRVVWGVIAALLVIAGTLFALMQVQDWSF
jgi:hypothetical protein